MIDKNKGVATRHPEYEEYSPLWQRCDDAAEGQHAIHNAGKRYLPRLTDESDDAYSARVARSDFFNATWRTIAGFTGMAFSRDPKVAVPSALEPYLTDINLEGVSLNDLAKDCVEQVLEYGRVGLLVDFPQIPGNVSGITVAAAESLGLRPKIVVYEAEHCINWRFATVNGRKVVSMVVLTEEASIAENEFEHKTETRYRVLDLDPAGLYRQRVFRKNDRNEDEQIGADIYPLMNGKPMTFVPFCFVGTGGKGDDIDAPPLIDLVNANIAHYQINADYRHGLHFTGLPTPVISGYTPEKPSEKFYIGSLSAWVFPDPGAKASYLEFTGQGLEETRLALADKKNEMAVLGARMLTDQARKPATATQAVIETQGENSILAAIVISVSKAVEWALGVFAQWVGATGEITFEINRKFLPTPMDPQMIREMVAGWQAGAISESELFAKFQEGGVIAGEQTFEAHQEEVASNPAAMPRPVVDPAAQVAA